MWTPRRIVLLTVGVAVVIAVFAVYNRFLGWIDGLPALPKRYLEATKGNQPPIDRHSREDRIDGLLREAFGDNCAESRYRYKTFLQAQRMLLAFEEIKLEDGIVELWPFSIAVIGKINPKSGYPEINTIHCDVAKIRFDRKIEALSDISHSKIVSAEFACDPSLVFSDPRREKIFVVNNHGTPQTSDDLIASTRGPVYFEDNADKHPDQPQLWTKQPIEITDYQPHPLRPHTIKADSMSMYLEPQGQRSAAGDGSGKERSSSIRKIELGNVNMSLTVDRPSDFLAPSSGTPQPTQPNAIPPCIHIQTAGSFIYDVRSNRAFFTIPPPTAGLRQYVNVTRDQPLGNDEMQCDLLELQLRKRTPAAAGAAAPVDSSSPSQSVEIASLRATGERVVLTSATEKLYAVGTELTFDNDRRDVALRGLPTMSAIKDGNRIETAELIMHRPDPNAPQPPVVMLNRAPGPGTVYMHDEKGLKTVEARWRGQLQLDRVGDRDRISLTGGTEFEDRENHQWLSGDEIKIWLAPPQPSAGASAQARTSQETNTKPAGNGTGPSPDQHGKPEKMHVVGHVKARTPDLKIDNTPMLVVWFQDADKTATGDDHSVADPNSPARSVLPGMSAPAAAGSPSNSTTASGPPAAPPKNPVEVSADYVEATIVRTGDRSEMSRVNCRAHVHVHQQPTDPKERPTDVSAQLLELTHTDDGDVLRLSGTTTDLARVQAREMTLHGPQIVFDQRDNRVNVDGAGYVVLITATNLSGERLERPTEVTIQWNGRMDLIGNRISFHGGVQAEQANTRVVDFQTEKELNKILCPRMDVTLDRPVAFNRLRQDPVPGKQPAGGDDQPKIKRVQCHRGEEGVGMVTVASNTWRTERLVRYQQILAPEVSYENDISEMNCTGPGEMRLFQLGDASDPLLPDAGAAQNPSVKTKKPATPEQQTFKLTQIKFADHLRASDKTQSANFKGQVRVYHGPTDDQNLVINPDKLEPGFFTLTCRELDVASHNESGRRWATMDAKGKADVYSPEFSGRADLIKYDESKKQLVVFDSVGEGNTAVLYYFKVKGQPPMQLIAGKILYWRSKNEFRLVDGRGAIGSN